MLQQEVQSRKYFFNRAQPTLFMVNLNAAKLIICLVKYIVILVKYTSLLEGSGKRRKRKIEKLYNYYTVSCIMWSIINHHPTMTFWDDTESFLLATFQALDVILGQSHYNRKPPKSKRQNTRIYPTKLSCVLNLNISVNCFKHNFSNYIGK